MKKKILILLTALCIFALCLTGCGSENAGSSADADSIQSSAGAENSINLADGVYEVDFETDSSMFKVNETKDGKGTLTVKDGKAVVHVTLGSKNIVNIYMGAAADAAEHESDWLQPTTDTVTYSDGISEEAFGFDIPVSVIDEDFNLAIIGKKGVWYDHTVSVNSPVLIGENAANNINNTNSSQAAAVPADGKYECTVQLSGGSGRASVQSPCAVTVENGAASATVVWSSPYYEYMMVDGVKYEPLKSGAGDGNSVFEIPVIFDTDMPVSACTVAMSEPHLVDYTLNFDSTALKKAD